MSEDKPMRINKFLSRAGVCSRRQADRLLKQGKVKINGGTPELGTKVEKGDEVSVEGKLVQLTAKNTYLAFNKPRGIVCTTDSGVEKNNIIDYINYPTRVFPIGRLDKESEGLILLTDDGAIVNEILRSRNDRGKEYIVQVDRPVTIDFIKKMGQGVPILDTITKKCTVQRTGDYTFRLVLTQGLNRQIRRMCAYFDYKVVRLERIRVINIELGNLSTGEYRALTQTELSELKRIINF